MKTRTIVASVLVVAVAVIVSSVLAQRGGQDGPHLLMMQGGPAGPGGPGALPGPPMMMKFGESGVYALMGGDLIKYDAETLRQVATLTLKEKPADADTTGEMPPKPVESVIMLLSPGGDKPETSILVILGDEFFRIDAASFSVKAQTTLPTPEIGDDQQPPQDGGSVRPPMAPPPGPRQGPPVVELKGSVLYMLRGPEILAVNITDGKVIAQGELPHPEVEPGR